MCVCVCVLSFVRRLRFAEPPRAGIIIRVYAPRVPCGGRHVVSGASVRRAPRSAAIARSAELGPPSCSARWTPFRPPAGHVAGDLSLRRSVVDDCVSSIPPCSPSLWTQAPFRPGVGGPFLVVDLRRSALAVWAAGADALFSLPFGVHQGRRIRLSEDDMRSCLRIFVHRNRIIDSRCGYRDVAMA